MLNFFKKHYLKLSVGLAFVTLLIMSFSHSRQTYDYFFSKFFDSLIYPFNVVTTNLAGSVEDLFDSYLFLIDTKQKNVILKEELEKITNENIQLKEDLKNYANLKEALYFNKSKSTEQIYAKIIAKVNNQYSKLIVIDKGSKDGIKKNLGVVSNSAAIGKIVRVGSNHAVIQLITDIQSKISVLIEKSGREIFLVGDGGENMLLKAIPREENLEKGDIILTSDLLNLFPSGYKVGEVESLYNKEFNWFQEAKIKPAVNLNAIKSVFVVKNDYLDQIKALIETSDQN